MIKYCKTPFNRTNSELIRILLNDIQKKGLWHILTLPQFMKSYWPFISGAILAYVIVFLASGNRKIYAPALFIMGLMKMGFSFLVYDPNPVTWHNFPASIVMVGGMLLQLQQTPRMNLRPWPTLRFCAALFLLSLAVYFFISTQVRFWEAIRYDYSRVNAPKNVLESRMMSLAKVKKEIDSREVVAINGYTSKDWVDGYRYTFAMRGITNSPAGIADYIVFDRMFPGRRELTDYLAHTGKAEFEPIMNDDFFVLFKRKAITRENLASRRTFIENLGAEAIGGGVQYQEVIVSDRETN